MQAFLRRFQALLPQVRAELIECHLLLKALDRAERLATKGRLDEKALSAIYTKIPKRLQQRFQLRFRSGRTARRANKSADGELPLPNTTKLLVELNRVIKLWASTSPGKR
jgi:hypothetical protein